MPVVLALVLWGAAEQAAQATNLAPQRYQEAMLAALQVPAAPPAHTRLPAFPRVRDLHWPTQDLRVGFWDMLTLQGCQLGVLAGERNSPLGRVMPASERLVYELRLLAALPRCQVEDPELREELTTILTHKRSELPAHLSNAIWGGPEMRGLLTAGFAADSPGHVRPAAGALRDLADYLGQPQDDPGALREPLAALHRHRDAGGVIRQAAASLQALTSVSLALEAAGDGSTPCPPGQAVRSTFESHYVGSFQPQLARLQQPLDQLLTALGAVFQAAPKPAPLHRFAAAFDPGEQGLAARLRQASRRHAQAVLGYTARCHVPLLRR